MPERKIAYSVLLREAASGKSVIHRDEWPAGGEESLEDVKHLICFEWGENNHSCDCNRILFFKRAQGIQAGVAGAGTCIGSGRFVVDWIKFDGSEEIVYRDDRK